MMRIKSVLTPDMSRKSRINTTTGAFPIKALLIISFSVISGVAVYILLYEALHLEVNGIFSQFSQFAVSAEKSDLLLKLIISSVSYVMILLFLSTSVIGKPYIYAVVVVKFTGLAVSVSYLYSSYGLKGIEYSILIFLPGKFFLIFSSLILIDFSTFVINRIRDKNKFSAIDIKTITLLLVIAIVMAFIGVIIDFSTLTMFSGLFSF